MEKGKKSAKIQEDGVKYLIEQGYKKISTKTFISDIELEHFLNKDFKNINKTRALGFIQILQREYDVDLSELKKAYLEHEQSSRKKEPETLFIEKPMKKDKEWQKYLPHLALILAFAGLIFFLWNNQNASSIDSLKKPSEENRSIIKEAQKNIEKLESSKTDNQAKKEINSSLPKLDNDLAIDNDLDKIVLQMLKERNISTDIKEEVKIVQLPKEEIKPVTTEKKEIIEKPKKTTQGKLYIIPTQKAWVGIIYLDDFSKKDFLIRSRLPLDASRNQLIVIGHRHFKIYNKTYSVKFMGRGPVRFIYRDGELMEINNKEFIKTSEGVVW